MAIWSLIGSPVLCVAGALRHDCGDCAEAASDSPACCAVEVADCGEDDGCGHESDCELDPCGNTVIRPESSSDFLPDLSPAPLLVAVDPGNDLRGASVAVSPVHIPERTPPPTLHRSDIPLLI